MIAYFTLLNAFLLSGVAAYYSVIGLASIFPGSYWPIVIMGSVLECSKLVTASWLYRNWKTVPIALKLYLTSAVAILMLITSMGIFGYLSKAHLEHSADVGPLSDKVAIYDEKIKTAKENIDANRKALKQMDEAVDQIMVRSSDEKGADKANTIRRSQAKERNRLNTEISSEQETISKLSETRAPLANELRKAESDFGPIKYVAELIYSSGDREIIDKAVRLVIMLIMIVFDPLAVLLLISANISLKQDEEPKNPIVEEREVIPTPTEEVVEEETNQTDTPTIVEEDKIVEDELAPETRPTPSNQKMVHVSKENLIVIDDATGETIPGITPTLEPKYDYADPYSFREKGK
jgi:hypothetical protein